MPSRLKNPRCPNCGSASTIWVDGLVGYSFRYHCRNCNTDHIVLWPHFSRRAYETSGAEDWLWPVALALAMLCSFLLFGK